MKIKMRDIFDFRVLPHPKHIVPVIQTTEAGSPGTFEHEKAGIFQINNVAFPHMHILNMGWETGAEDLILFDDPMPSETVNINLQLSGIMHTTFPGLDHNLNMQHSTHNLVYIPEAGDMHQIPGNQTLSLFHISIDKNFFIDAIGQNDLWSNNACEALIKNRAFSGIPGTLKITPYMKQLIHSIHRSEATGVMRNLLIQSRVFELISLQIAQFTQGNKTNTISKEDNEKLHLLKLYLDEHFLSDLNLTQLSLISLLNEFKLKNGFKQLFGTTVFSYIRNLRMHYAKRLLTDTNLSIDEIANITGYEHSQHFATAFKKHFSLTPSAIRK